MGGWADNLVTKARERGLERAAAAYAVAGWLLVQAASIALPAYQAPAWMLRWLIAATILGFPVAITVGWIVNRERPTTVARFGWLDAALLTVIGTVVALTFAELAWHWSANPNEEGEATGLPPPQASIAVLPFANTSGDVNQRYFSEGLTDELIGLLARNSGLRVAARTSSYFFEGKSGDIRTIARKLNVRTVLEGNVRSANGRLRIETDLINAADGYQLWSESYDRPSSDVLLVQADIAGAIAKALTPKLLGKSSVPVARAIDPEVYRLFLQGQFDMGLRTPDSVQSAADLFRRVVERAPDFAEGQAALAYDLDLVIAFGSHDQKLAAERNAALSKTISLDPDNPNARTLSIELAYRDFRWDAVIDNALVLKRANAHSVDSLRGLAFAYEEFGLSNQELAAWQQAVRLDPFSYNARMNLADTLSTLSRFHEAVDQIKQALKLSPGNIQALADLCGTLGLAKQTKDAEAALANLSTAGGDKNELFDCRFSIAMGKGDTPELRKLADEVRTGFPKNGVVAGGVASYLQMAGETKLAGEWYERAYDDNNDLFNAPFTTFFPKEVFRSARWIALTKRPRFQAWFKARERALRVLAGP